MISCISSKAIRIPHTLWGVIGIIECTFKETFQEILIKKRIKTSGFCLASEGFSQKSEIYKVNIIVDIIRETVILFYFIILFLIIERVFCC